MAGNQANLEYNKKKTWSFHVFHPIHPNKYTYDTTIPNKALNGRKSNYYTCLSEKTDFL